MQSQSHWYLGSKQLPCANSARDAFAEALAVFKPKREELENFDKLKHLKNLQEVQHIVESAQSNYEQQDQTRKTKKWLSRLASRICFYGRIFDVMVNHHPEYVSLAWGAFKLLFILVENHEKHITHLAKGLAQIADALPRIELANILYPTDRMKEVVAQLYCHIIRFFIRAESWYQQSKARHAWEALARPVELHYNDLIEEIERCTMEINELAAAGSRAEQRDMHLELLQLREDLKNSGDDAKSSKAMLQEVKGLILMFQSLQQSANLDTNQRLTDLQLNQVMDFLSSERLADPLKVLQYRAFMIGQRKNRQQDRQKERKFWTNPKFNTWEAATLPHIILVKGNPTSRLQVQSFTVEIVKLLLGQKTPVLWALKPVAKYKLAAPSVIDVIKDLTCQAIQLNMSLHTEGALALSCTQFRSAKTAQEWMSLLARGIANISRLYIVVDLEAVGFAFSRDFSWLTEISAMIRKYDQQLKGQLKILLVSCGRISKPEEDQYRDLIVAVRQNSSGPPIGGGPSMRGKTLDYPLSMRGSGRGRRPHMRSS